MKKFIVIFLFFFLSITPAFSYVVGSPPAMLNQNWAQYAVDPAADDQGAASTTNVTLKNVIDAVGTGEIAVIVFPHNGADNTTTYTLSTAETVPSNFYLDIQPGAVIQPAAGISLTAYSPANIIAQPNQQIVDIGTGGHLAFTIGGEIYPDWWGCIGDGSTDDATEMQETLDVWGAMTTGGQIVLTPGKNYLINSALSYTFSTANITSNLDIEGYGSKITSGVSSDYLLTFTASTKLIRHLTIRGLRVQGSNDSDSILKIDGGDSASSEYFYNVSLEDLKFENFGGNGIHLSNNVFETQLTRCELSAALTNTTGIPIYFENDTSGTVSSIDVIACTTRYGLYGLYAKSDVSDIKIFGGTYLLAQQYGIYLANQIGGVIEGVHVENNWASASSNATTQAGIYLVNSGTIIGCYGTTNNSFAYQTTLARVYAADYINLIGNRKTGNMTTNYYIHGVSGSEVNIMGSGIYDAPAGTPTQIMRYGGYYKSTVDASTSGTGEDDLKSFEIPAKRIGISGGVKIIASGTKTGANGNKTIKFYFGATGFTFNTAANDTNDWYLEAYIYNDLATNAQNITWRGWNGATPLQGFETAAIDTTAAVTVKITGECANAGDTITQTILDVRPL